MSGVAKDDTNPNSPKDETVPVAGETDAAKADGQAAPSAISASAKDEAEPRARRAAPHLRVVTDNAEDVPAAPAEPTARIGEVIRKARENKGFTLEQVSRDTRVHVSHLRAIEDMRPGLLGAPVYAKGYIKSYARFLGMDEQGTLDRFLSECAAILKDPEKPEVVVTATSKARRLPVAVPMLGILAVVLVGGGIATVVMGNSGKAPPVTNETPAIGAGVGPTADAAAPQFKIVALKNGHLTVRSSKGDKFVDRAFFPGQSFILRVGAGFTVTVDDGSAFEWRMGEQSLGLLQPEGGPVYAQNVDLAAQRQPVVTDAPPAVPPTTGSAATGLTPNGDPLPVQAPSANPAPAKPRPVKPTPAPSQSDATPPPAEKPAAPPPPPRDPALDAYPGQ